MDHKLKVRAPSFAKEIGYCVTLYKIMLDQKSECKW